MPAQDLLNSVLRVYLRTTLAYGFTRAVTYDYKSTDKYFNENTRHTEVKDMLLVHKIGKISGNTCAAVVAWPFMIHDDLTLFECALRGKDPKEYQ